MIYLNPVLILIQIDFINAKYDEIEKFTRFNAYEEVPDSGRTCVSTTWVFNCKEDKVRARLVARGYKENTDTRTDSATIMKSSFRTFLTIASSQQWTLKQLILNQRSSKALQYRVISLLNPQPNLKHRLV